MLVRACMQHQQLIQLQFRLFESNNDDINNLDEWLSKLEVVSLSPSSRNARASQVNFAQIGETPLKA